MLFRDMTEDHRMFDEKPEPDSDEEEAENKEGK